MMTRARVLKHPASHHEYEKKNLKRMSYCPDAYLDGSAFQLVFHQNTKNRDRIQVHRHGVYQNSKTNRIFAGYVETQLSLFIGPKFEGWD